MIFVVNNYQFEEQQLIDVLEGPDCDFEEEIEQWIEKQIGEKPDSTDGEWDFQCLKLRNEYNEKRRKLKYTDFVEELKKKGYKSVEYIEVDTLDLDINNMELD